ncbi:hypothetical protein CBER1_04184 [Cercospora berteroae]|uniref:DNA-directed RNA polymerase III subunit RPC9 n=1 Tax=Cercospora berteroae TaxID=357750 RepID=A0A2S6CNB1_9PEZI|nr:hypothetical protein CBER1_04184 [Cercospora berteroae]
MHGGARAVSVPAALAREPGATAPLVLDNYSWPTESTLQHTFVAIPNKMKILDAGDSPLSNADVLDWVERKRAQHAAEDADDKAKGQKPAIRPKNFMRVLDRTERELKSSNYPYVRNPTAYSGDARSTAFQKFARDAEDAMQASLEAEWHERLQSMPKEQFEKEFELEQEKKCLTEPEVLMIYNYAPQCVEMLQPMIENVEDRFTADEQQVLVEIISRNLRPNEIPQEEQSAE